MDELGLFTVALGLSGLWRVVRTEFDPRGRGRPAGSAQHAGRKHLEHRVHRDQHGVGFAVAAGETVSNDDHRDAAR